MRRTDFSVLETRRIAQQVFSPSFTAADWALFFVAALALIVIGATS